MIDQHVIEGAEEEESKKKKKNNLYHKGRTEIYYLFAKVDFCTNQNAIFDKRFFEVFFKFMKPFVFSIVSRHFWGNKHMLLILPITFVGQVYF